MSGVRVPPPASKSPYLAALFVLKTETAHQTLSQLCPEKVLDCPSRDPNRWLQTSRTRRIHVRDKPSTERSRLPSSRRPQRRLVCEVPAARRPPGATQDRASMDTAWPPRQRLLHQAHSRELACSRHQRSAAGGAGRDGAHRRNIRGRCRRVHALDRARPPAQALNVARLPVDHQRPSAARLRSNAPRGHHDRADRTLLSTAGSERDDEQPHASEGPHSSPRRHAARPARLEASTQPRQ